MISATIMNSIIAIAGVNQSMRFRALVLAFSFLVMSKMLAMNYSGGAELFGEGHGSDEPKFSLNIQGI
jgi:hypothetical protein